MTGSIVTTHKDDGFDSLTNYNKKNHITSGSSSNATKYTMPKRQTSRKKNSKLVDDASNKHQPTAVVFENNNSELSFNGPPACPSDKNINSKIGRKMNWHVPKATLVLND